MAALGLRAAEVRAEELLCELLRAQGWDPRRPPAGELLRQHEYRSYSSIAERLLSASKSGGAHGVPEAILIDRGVTTPLAVVEAKASTSEIDRALQEAQNYADALTVDHWRPLAIGLAGTSEDEFALRVAKRVGRRWVPVTYDKHPINWIPTRADLELISVPGGPTEIRPSVPPLEVLADRANEINRLLREARIKDEFRPAVVAAIMLALWHSAGAIRRDPRYILADVNSSCRDAFLRGGKADLAKSLRVEEANEKLREKAVRIARILERLNVTVLTAEHDYLGQLYETFFRYTGGNTIGQYFTPRHLTRMMADVCEITKDDIVLDPACGTGGFLVACMDRILTTHRVSRAKMVSIVKKNLIGFEDEPVTAALCVANMILRGDGSTGVHRADAFTSPDFPKDHATVVLMNPPFPHQKTDTPVEQFVARALEGLQNRGRLATILPMSLLVKRDKGPWREGILKRNRLLAVCQLPDELFQPFASATTAFVVIEKGVPHDPRRETTFVRLHHDGLALRKGARVERDSEPNQIPAAVDAITNNRAEPGFAGKASVSGRSEWAPGAYIPSAPPEEGELKDLVDVSLRRLASFYTRYGKEVVTQRRAIADGDLTVEPYRAMVTAARRQNAKAISADPGTIGGTFEILYGMKELHSREGIPPGPSLIVSPTEEYNGCYGWLEFPTLMRPPFVTVAQTGSIGEAFVQFEPCAVNDDCLVLLPREGVTIEQLVLAAATLQSEKWRFTYGRKLTPPRIAEFLMPSGDELERWVRGRLVAMSRVIAASLAPYQTEDEMDLELSQNRLAEVTSDPAFLLSGEDLDERLSRMDA